MSSPTRARATDAFMQRIEELCELLDKNQATPHETLDVLLTAVAKGYQPTEAWNRLHEITLRDDRAAELAIAYEKLTTDRRIKILAAEQRAYLFLRAANFVGDLFGDIDGATRYAELALSAVPGHLEAFNLLERLLGEAEKSEQLALLYYDASRTEREDPNRVPLLKRAASLVNERPLAHELALKILHAWVACEPSNDTAKEALTQRLIAAAKFRDAAKLLEEKLAQGVSAKEAPSIHERLVELYINQVKEPKEAIAHLEAILRADPNHARAIAWSEALLENRAVAERAAAALSDAYERAGDVPSAIAMLTMELKLVKGSRKLEVQKRLAILRHDALGDKAGALELLAPVVSAWPGDDDLRRRYVNLSLEIDQPKEAALLLARALQTTREPAVRASIGVDAGRLYLRTGETRRALGVFQQVIDGGSGEQAMLEAARHLVDLYGEVGDTKNLAQALAMVVRWEPDTAVRQAAARRLTRLYDGEGVEEERGIEAWRALLGSEWTEEALVRLERIYQRVERVDSNEGRAELLAFRAGRAGDPEKARELAFASALLRTQHLTDPASALKVWSEVLARFGQSAAILEKTVPLFEQVQDWEGLARSLTLLIECVDDEQKPDYLARLAQVNQGRLAKAEEAISALGAALSIDSSHRASRVLLERLLFTEGTELAAADILEPIYRSESAAGGLVKVLSVRGRLQGDLPARFEALYEALTLAQHQLGDPERALELAGQGLNLAVQHEQAVRDWLERVNRLSELVGSAAAKAQVLSQALGDRAVNSQELFELCRLTGEALGNASELDAAIDVYRRALEFDPVSRDVLERIDRLLVEQGNPNERMVLYRAALEQEQDAVRRKELLHSIATLEYRELGQRDAAIASFQRALSEDYADIFAHQALIDLFTEAGEIELVYQQLEALLPLVTAERRSKTLVRLAKVAEQLENRSRALSHYRTLLDEFELGDDVLQAIESLASQEGATEVLRQALEQRLERAADPTTQADIYERLGAVLADQVGDTLAAVAAWMRGAELSLGLAADSVRALRMYRQVLEVAPRERQAAERLVELYAKDGVYPKLPAAFQALAGAAAARDWLPILLGLEGRLLQAGALDTFIVLIDEALERDLEKLQRQQLMSTKARVLTTDPSRHQAAVALFKELLLAEANSADVLEFERFLEAAGSDAFVEEQRWLFDWKAKRATEPVGILLDWADTEHDRFGEPDRAIDIYQRILGIDPERVDAMQHLASLKVEQGDFKGALSTLEKLRSRTDGDARVSLELDMAAILIDQLRKPAPALALVGPILAGHPRHAEANRMVQKALGFDETRLEAAELLEKAALALDDDAAHGQVLGRLLEVSEGMPELREARKRWIKRVIELEPHDDQRLYALSLAAARDARVDEELWEAAERCAQKLHEPGPLAEAYAAALEADLDPDAAALLGQRVVNFHEEWFDDSEKVVQLMRRVLSLAPRATWAFDRLKLVFNSNGRWEDLFALYDWALEQPSDKATRLETLREAAMAAKDFASDKDRAIAYFEELNRLVPRDARVESALERLYERYDQAKPLIDLLTTRLEVADESACRQYRLRIASLWMSLDRPAHAFGTIVEVLDSYPDDAEAFGLLERLLISEEPGSEATLREDLPPEVLTKERVRERSAELLAARYHVLADHQRVVAMLEVLVETAENEGARVERLNRLVEARLSRLDDAGGAFESVCELVRLRPEDLQHRELFSKLANRLAAYERQVAVLVEVGRSQLDKVLGAAHLIEAAQVRALKLGDQEGAIALYTEVLDNPEVEAAQALLSARELDVMLESQRYAEERCRVLEKLAQLETDDNRRLSAWATAATLAFEALGDPQRSIANWRHRLAHSPKDGKAIDGLIRALEATSRFEELIESLRVRISITKDPAAAKGDAVRVAHIYEKQCKDPERAVLAWQTVRASFGADPVAFEALVQLLSGLGRYTEVAALVAEEAGREADAARRDRLFRQLGAVYDQHTKQPMSALDAFIEGGDFQAAREVAGAARTDRDLARSLLERLLELSVKIWKGNDLPLTSAAAKTASWAIEGLRERGLEEGNHRGVVELLLEASKLPLSTPRKRQLIHEAACLLADHLAEPARATALLRDLFREEPADDVAQGAVSRLAGLLSSQGLDEEVTALWEEQADCKEKAQDRSGAAILFARAGELCLDKLGDQERAIANYRRGAALGGEASLVELARLYTENGEPERAAEVLEWLCAQSPREALAGRALQLANAYVACNRRSQARARLEQAQARSIDGAGLRARLAELYREDEDWDRLAALLTEEAQRAEKPAVRLSHLREAARLHMALRAHPEEAVPLLEEASAIDADSYELSLLLSDALMGASRLEDAMLVLKQRIESYGSRRPKERALVHLQLAKVCLAARDRVVALSELDKASKIDPAHPEVLFTLARLALEEGQLDRAERQYRGLLLIIGRDSGSEGPTRVESLLDLARIATLKEDPVRAEEFIEGAFEAAAENQRELEVLKRALRDRGEHTLLIRTLSAALEQSARPGQAISALAELAQLLRDFPEALSERALELNQRALSLQNALEAGDPGNAEAWSALGQAFQALGNADAEAKILERRVRAWIASGADSKDAESCYRLAALKLEDPATRAEGTELLSSALDADPNPERAIAILKASGNWHADDKESARLMERLSRETQDHATRLTALLSLVRFEPQNEDAAKSAYKLAVERNDSASAENVLRAALSSLGSDSSREFSSFVLLRLAKLCDAAGQMQEALDLRERAIAFQEAERKQKLVRQVAEAAMAVSDYHRAIRNYEVLYQDSPEDRSVWEPLLAAHRQLGNTERLLELIEATVPSAETSEDRARLRLEEANVLLSKPGKEEEAILRLKQVLTEDPKQVDAALILAQFLESTGRLGELSELLNEQLAEARQRQHLSSILSLSMRLGDLLERQDKSSDALNAYKVVLGYDRRSTQALGAVLRLSQAKGDVDSMAEALEGLLATERGARAEAICEQLYNLRTERGEDEAALRALELGFDACPMSSRILAELLSAYRRRGSHSDVCRVLQRAYDERPHEVSLLHQLIEAYSQASLYENALALLEPLIEGSAPTAELLVWRGRVLGELGRDLDSLADFERANAMTGQYGDELGQALERAVGRADSADRPKLLLRWVNLLLSRGDRDTARSWLTELVKECPKDAGLLRRLAEMEEEAEQYDKASAAYRKLVALEEGEALVATALCLGRVCRKAGRFGDARGALERAVQAAPHHQEVSAMLHQLYEETGAHADLAELLIARAGQAKDVGERLSLLHKAAEHLLEPEGDLRRAMEILNEARELSPESVEGVVLLARAEVAGGRLDRAEATLVSLIESYRGRRAKVLSQVHRELARLQLQKGEAPSALASMTHAFEMDLKNYRVAMELGELALEHGDDELATRAFRTVAMMRSDEEDGVPREVKGLAHFQLAVIADRQGDPRRAKVLVAKALSENPELAGAEEFVRRVENL